MKTTLTHKLLLPVAGLAFILAGCESAGEQAARNGSYDDSRTQRVVVHDDGTRTDRVVVKDGDHVVNRRTVVVHASDPTNTSVANSAMHLETSHTNLLVNESTTVLVKSANTLGERPKITWKTTFGKINPVKDGMLDFRSDKPTAIFTSDKPGTAIVTATLTLDSGQSFTDSVQINVGATR